MAIATPEVYNEMIDRAKEGKFAYPAVNITSSQTITAALQGFAEAESDGIIQVSVGGAEYGSGATIKDRVSGSLALAAYAAEVAKSYPITVAIHTDHCAKQNLDSWVRPLLAIEAEQVKAGKLPTFQSHMWDGSSVPLDENLVIAEELLELSQAARTILEIEVGVVGGEEDGHEAEINEKLYTTVEDGLATVKALGTGEKGRYLTALTFGNVHGVYKPGNVVLTPTILRDSQEYVSKKHNLPHNSLNFVFHGGSGSTAQEIKDSVSYGVVKMNIDTDTQWATWEGVLNYYKANEAYLQGQLGNPKGEDQPNKKYYDPRVWLRAGQTSMIARLEKAFQELNAIDVL